MVMILNILSTISLRDQYSDDLISVFIHKHFRRRGAPQPCSRSLISKRFSEYIGYRIYNRDRVYLQARYGRGEITENLWDGGPAIDGNDPSEG